MALVRSAAVGALSARLYPRITDRDTVPRFVERLRGMLRPTDVVLDLGAGAGARNTYALRGRVRRLVGVDYDPRVGSNPLLDAGIRGDVTALPFRDSTFDVVFAIYVLEHVTQPTMLAAEIHRVLRPGGLFVTLTPNVAHYATLAARLTPTAFHRWFNERRGRLHADTFPTAYRLNSKRALTAHFAAAGLERLAVEGVEVQPNYLTFSTVAFLGGVVYERIVNASERLSAIRVNLIASFRKPVRHQSPA